MSIKMVPATARAGVIFGFMGSPSILGVVVPVTLSEPLAIGVAVMNAVELDAAAFIAFAGAPEVLLIPSDEELGVASPGVAFVEWVIEIGVASLMDVVASRGSIAYG